LEALVTRAATASASDRIDLRDPIAAFGAEAVEAMTPWLSDTALGAFAVRVIGKAADRGARPEALAALRHARGKDLPEVVRGDINSELARLGAEEHPASNPRRSTRKSKPTPTRSLEELVVGRVYSRQRDLHRHGLGGNWQKGASYPEVGDYVLCFSDPARERDFGYRDTWQGPDEYRFFGEWNGPGDMTMTAGNAAIRDRSPELHLFVAAPGGHRYEGRFSCEGHELEPTVREGRQFTAIVFRLVRVER
jgi:hypothetical protein